jgi:hypothetical protein
MKAQITGRFSLQRADTVPIGSACLTGIRIGRGIAQPGRALSSGGRGRRFESSFPDHILLYF